MRQDYAVGAPERTGAKSTYGVEPDPGRYLLCRKVPTLLIDEGDTFLPKNNELRGLLNSGHHRKGAYVMRAIKRNGSSRPSAFPPGFQRR